jgi:hypothetical protein
MEQQIVSEMLMVVVVVLVVGPISTAAIKTYCTLTPNGVP